MGIIRTIRFLSFVLGPAAALLSVHCTREPLGFRESRETFTLGDTRVVAILSCTPGSDLTLFNMHDDENTAVEAGLAFTKAKGGCLLQLSHSGERLIKFHLESQSFLFDPNRIFTDEGARQSLERNGAFSVNALAEVRRFAEGILGRFDLLQKPVIITVHNNTENGYSALSYKEGAIYGGDAESLFLSPEQDPDDFFFVTEREVFKRLKQDGFNAVLQNNREASDDGSLSVLAGRLGLPYINVEAQHGHQKEQIRMLEEVYKIIDRSTSVSASHKTRQSKRSINTLTTVCLWRSASPYLRG